jgi:hypothetical protein
MNRVRFHSFGLKAKYYPLGSFRPGGWLDVDVVNEGVFLFKGIDKRLDRAIFQVRNYAKACLFLSSRNNFIVAHKEGVAVGFRIALALLSSLLGAAQRAWPDIEIARMAAKLRLLRKFFLMETDLRQKIAILLSGG